MSENEMAKVEAPDAGDFDLMSWIDGHHTYPEYTVTVHLDKATVVKANDLATKIENLVSERADIEQQMERTAPGNSGLNETSPQVKRHGEIAQEIKAKRAERKELLEKAKDSALKIVLRKPGVSGEDEDEGNVFDKLRKVLAERYPDHAAALNNMADQKGLQELFFANPHLAHEQNVLMWLSMVASVTNAKGQTIERGPKLTEAVLSNLIKRLDASDNARVQSNMNLALAGSELREEQIDAGFPR